ncbi:MAG: hypothetical protein H0V04_07595 [Chloroflexi bacterium]|nr:hypothetical protein [Chloroflexota bacterium]
MPRLARGLRILLYSHDTFGLGHVRRSLVMASALAGSSRVGAQLLVTGSPLADRFTLPPRTDIVKLPCVTKVGGGTYAPRSLPIGFDELLCLRRDLILAAARAFRPDIVLVDHAPAGMGGEIAATLRLIRRESPRTRIAVGLRDVVDDAAAVGAEWSSTGVHELLEDVYDRVLIYGQRSLYDPVREYGFSARAAAKTRFVGYLADRGAIPADGTRLARPLAADRRQVVVTVGGGGDGAHLLMAVVDAIADGRMPPDVGWQLVGGPFLPTEVRPRVRRAVRSLPHVRYQDFTPGLGRMLASASAVISMGGYNTVCELLASGTPALVVPRVEPRVEQLIRATALAAGGHIRMLHPAELEAERLGREVATLLDGPRPSREGLALDGVARATAELEALMARRAVAA